MTKPAQPELHDDAGVDEEAVASWLHTHPDFFDRHPELLETLRLTHGETGTVSLIERQVTVLRERNRALERRLADLMQVARENEGLTRQIHRLTLGLMEADGLDAVLATVNEILREEFRTAHVAVRLMAREGASGLHFTPQDAPVFARLEELLGNRVPRCGRFPREQIEAVFPDAAERISSTALIPLLDGPCPIGLLALGSEDAERFQPCMGTLFLAQLGETISGAILSRMK